MHFKIFLEIYYNRHKLGRINLMKSVRLTYEYSEVKLSVPILLFFRMIGVYVSESYLSSTINLAEDIERIKRTCPKVKEEDLKEFVYDVEIGLIKNQKQYDECKKRYDEYQKQYDEYQKRFKSDLLENKKKFILVGYGDKIEGVQYFKEDDVSNVIDYILTTLKDNKIISDDERTECIEAKKVFYNNKYTALTLNTKFFFRIDTEEEFNRKLEKYSSIVTELQLAYKTLRENLPSSYICYYLKYAIINVAYEVDSYCADYKHSMAFSIQSLLDFAQELENQIQGENDCFSIYSLHALNGQIYDDLLNNGETAFEYYLKCCDGMDKINAYVFMLKGLYCTASFKDNKFAIRYYLKSILIYHEYYRAWFKMGNCFIKMGDKKNALIAFNVVIKILSVRLEAEVIRPLEAEHLYLAYEKIALLTGDRREFKIAFYDLNTRFLNLLNKITASNFYDLMLMEEDSTAQAEEKQLLIKKVKNHIKILYNRVD